MLVFFSKTSTQGAGKSVGTVTTKKFKEDTDVEKLHTNAVKFVFKERKLDHVYLFMDPTTQKCVPQVPLNRLSWM
jgi:hypothetical protein